MTTSSTRAAGTAAVPCAARPYASLVHVDGACRCFAGGPPPEYAPPRHPGPRFRLVEGGLAAAPRPTAEPEPRVEHAC
jgi:hypothetical protein